MSCTGGICCPFAASWTFAGGLYAAGMDDSPLRGVVYEGLSQTLWYWLDASQDALVREFVQDFRTLPARDQVRIRSVLDGEAHDALRCYARRCALSALRQRAPHVVVDGFDALSTMDAERDRDPRDIAAAAMLLVYSARRLHMGLRSAVAPAIARSTPLTAKFLRDYLSWWLFLPRRLPQYAGFDEVITPQGPAFAVNFVSRFRPTVDLVAAAWAAIGVIEADGYRAHNLSVGQALHPVGWRIDQRPSLKAQVDRGRAYVELSCFRPVKQDLDIFYAEAANPTDAQEWANAIEELQHPRRPAIASAHDRFCIVAVASTTMADHALIEDTASLERFRVPLSRILRNLPS
jgi:hypothetical protein